MDWIEELTQRIIKSPNPTYKGVLSKSSERRTSRRGTRSPVKSDRHFFRESPLERRLIRAEERRLSERMSPSLKEALNGLKEHTKTCPVDGEAVCVYFFYREQEGPCHPRVPSWFCLAGRPQHEARADPRVKLAQLKMQQSAAQGKVLVERAEDKLARDLSFDLAMDLRAKPGNSSNLQAMEAARKLFSRTIPELKAQEQRVFAWWERWEKGELKGTHLCQTCGQPYTGSRCSACALTKPCDSCGQPALPGLRICSNCKLEALADELISSLSWGEEMIKLK